MHRAINEYQLRSDVHAYSGLCINLCYIVLYYIAFYYLFMWVLYFASWGVITWILYFASWSVTTAPLLICTPNSMVNVIPWMQDFTLAVSMFIHPQRCIVSYTCDFSYHKIFTVLNFCEIYLQIILLIHCNHAFSTIFYCNNFPSYGIHKFNYLC